jgi:hypothetical protein
MNRERLRLTLFHELVRLRRVLDLELDTPEELELARMWRTKAHRLTKRIMNAEWWELYKVDLNAAQLCQVEACAQRLNDAVLWAIANGNVDRVEREFALVENRRWGSMDTEPRWHLRDLLDRCKCMCANESTEGGRCDDCGGRVSPAHFGGGDR